MVRIEKMYFNLKEVAKRWGVRKRDLAYMAENAMLRVSVRLEGVRLERGILEFDDSREFRIPYEQAWFSGILDLRRCDAFRIFRDGHADIVYFDKDGHEYVAAMEPTASIRVLREHLVVQRSERDRVEALHASAGHTVAEGIGFQHSADYRNVGLGSVEMNLGIVQAEVMRLLHAAALTETPWCDGKRVLSEAGATSMRMSDVLKSQRHWRRLIQSDGRGRYRLRLRPE